MKSNLKLVLSLLLLFSLTVLTLISCQSTYGNTNPTQSQSADGQTLADSELEQTTEPPEFTPDDGVDYGGYKFRILGYDGEATGTWQIAAISEIIAEEEIGEPIHDAFYRRNRQVEALYNIEFGIVPVTYPNRGDFDTKFRKAVMAGDDQFDSAFMLGSSIPTALSRKDAAYDLSDIPALDLTKSWWDQNSVKDMSIGGTLSAVIGDVNFYSAIAPLVLYTNKKLMRENEAGDLYQLARDGKWTWDVMYSISKNVTKDLNGDGAITQDDQIGLAYQANNLFEAVNSAGEYITPKNTNDIPEYAPNMDRIAGIVEKVATFFRDKNASLSSEDIKGVDSVFFGFIMPKFRDNEIMFNVFQLLFSFELRSMEADFAILPFPKYDENQKNYNSILSAAWSTFTVIPTTCSDVERAAAILQAMGYYSQQYVMPAYYDITVTNKLLRDDDAAEMMDIILKNRVIDLAALYNWGDLYNVFLGIARSGDYGTLVSQLEKTEPKINKAIEKTLSELEGG